ncbi:hypothetical protein SLA2020_467370 [Shorea laevis]
MATKTPPSTQPSSSSSSSSSSSRRTCLCAPTTHPGSFRCARHRKVSAKPTVGGGNRVDQSKIAAAAATSKASLIKAILFQIIRPSSHDLQRRRNFRPKPSRFCLMNSTADGRVAVS